jgi:YidC/Oxa1 family membrane protein insertase
VIRHSPAALVALLTLVPCAAVGAPAAVTVETARYRIVFEAARAGPVGWRACAPTCAAPGALTTELLADGDAPGGIEVLLADADGGRLVPGPAKIGVAERPDWVEVTLRTGAAEDSGALEQRWLIPRDGYGVDYTATLSGASDVRLTGWRIATGGAFRPPPMPGFSDAYARVRPFALLGGVLDVPEQRPARIDLTRGDWAGVRARFWAVAAGPAAAAEARLPGGDVAELRIQDGRTLSLAVYIGPVEREALAVAGPGLGGLLYAELWAWLRWPARALGRLLDGLLALTGNAGLAIMLLSVVVKVLMTPVTALAERWQADVNRTHARLEPLLAAARANYRGEQRHERVLAAYRTLGVSPLYTMKSLAGYLIQIPVFIAAFAMLGEHFALAGTPWLWIADLSRPDALAPLPFQLPFFGGDFNLLPFLMTGLTVLAAVLHRDPDLTPSLLRAQRRRLYALAALFFVLFYTFPAAMVLYWTANNLLHLIFAHRPRRA